jgi:hypothetical protein
MSDTPITQPKLNGLPSASKRLLRLKDPMMTANGEYTADIISTQGKLGYPLIGYITDSIDDGTALHQWSLDGEHKEGNPELNLVNITSNSFHVTLYRNKKTGEFMTGEKKVSIPVDDVFNSTHQLEKVKTIEVDIDESF